MLSKIGDLIDRSLNTKVTPLAYLAVVLGIIRGAAFAFFQTAPGVSSTVTARVGTIVPTTLWGYVVLIFSLVLLVGLLKRSVSLVMAGSLVMALAWGCNMAAYALRGYWEYLVPYAAVSVLIYGYLFITAPLGRLWDYTPTKG